MLWKQFMRSFSKILKTILPVITMFAVIIAFHFTEIVYLKFYPVIVNFLLFILFFSSTFQEKTIIQRFALLAEPNAKPPVLDYTRKLTYYWSAFMLINAIISAITVVLPKNIWIIYNGFVSYFLVGLFFVIEYIIRINFKRKHDC